MSTASGNSKDSPWLMRTYAGHTDAAASNALFRSNLDKGQTGLSVAFDLPTQTGYDPDDPRARGEVGKVGVPIAHLGDLRALFEGIPLEAMNTSMTINATAPWLLALYVALAEERGIDLKGLRGTTQNDNFKEYLSRGTYVFPPRAALRLQTDVITYAIDRMPRWNPVNICSYHLREAGATAVQEIAYALVNAIEVLDSVRATGQLDEAAFARTVGRTSFFVNSGIRFVEETCKMRAFVELWDRICRERYAIADPKLRRFRYGVQVNSLGLTEQQPENNIYRIVFEMLGVTLSRDARARAVQLPAWNEALGLPRPWDQQWSLRAQQILAFETDLLEHGEILAGNPAIERLTAELRDEAWAELRAVLDAGGAVEAIESGHIKERLVAANALRLERIARGEQLVVGVNCFNEAEPSALMEHDGAVIQRVDLRVEAEQVAALVAWRSQRDAAAVERALEALRQAAHRGENILPPSIEAARVGVTTGEWGHTLREVFGEYEAPTGVRAAGGDPIVLDVGHLQPLRERAAAMASRLGRRPRILVGKPGLDGHSNGAEQIALHARDAGFDVVYEGIRLTPERIAAAALEEGVHLVGLSVLSGSHLELVPLVLEALREVGLGDLPVVVGGIIPKDDVERLAELGVARVYTGKDYRFELILDDLLSLIELHHAIDGRQTIDGPPRNRPRP